ncbi:prevent-host-death family protein [Gordonibacter massiliensis (ex Traore et al. 2017)]|uniref:Prevent-host-death family protein n=1 Tax=Gordonibacter massiliensis (ex Traore et al. 2017) TaxID=1841863 RepID=A0A842JGG5_9ACTN|nr:prevent-host-death family protein [Gordonibacter massiliensis (ex Traore et al. 2017)]MBC2888140.1 prevent-host-death family protein [Gordonibacter massiliensis (ex Traore et al. 2017)]
MAAPIIRSSTDIRRDYNGIEALAKETGQPIYLTKNGRASLVVIDAATFDYDQYVGLMIDEAIEHNKRHPQTYTAEEAKVEIDRLINEKMAENGL